MNLTGYWRMERAFNSRDEAEAFARCMAEKLDEPVFLYIDEVRPTLSNSWKDNKTETSQMQDYRL